DEVYEKRVVRHVGAHSLPVQRDVHGSHAFPPKCGVSVSYLLCFLTHALEYRYAKQKLCK
ncbi:MAG: hypothetical protein VXW17_02890, partial [Pseudomonadota bacterium]|nr:hypothetical protein [Pseudomonadota bacterium]